MPGENTNPPQGGRHEENRDTEGAGFGPPPPPWPGRPEEPGGVAAGPGPLASGPSAGVHGGTGEVGGPGFGPPAPPAYPPTVPPRPPAPAQPLRALAVGLLNLTGLGLGYAALRAWTGLAVCCIATGVLLVVALPADADGVPGALVVGYLLVLLAVAAHGAAKGLRTPLFWPPSPAVALALALALLLVPAGGTLLYDRAQDDAHHAAVERMLLGRLDAADRTVASAQGTPFATSQPRFRQALGTYRELAEKHPESAAAARVPDRLRAYYEAVGEPYAQKKYCEALAPLKYLRTVPATLGEKRVGSLADWPEQRLPTALYECGAAAVGSAGTAYGAPRAQFNELLADFPRSPQAARVEPALGRSISAAVKDVADDPCEATDRLKLLAAQAAALEGGPGAVATALDKDAARARGEIPGGAYACGVDAYRDKDFDTAGERLTDFVKTYENDRHVPLAKKIVTAAEIAGEEPAAGRKLPTLASGGSISVTLTNDSPDPVEVLYTGPVTGRVTLAACHGCKRYDWTDTLSPSFKPCSAGRNYPKRTISLPAGTTYFLHKPLGGGAPSSPGTDTAKLRPNYLYTECAYVTRGPGINPSDIAG
ncbi:hypothetical protein AB0J21_21235 [Streptomyces sp. NPDC049954]|uniref:hypothetical protein n=1 Tax=Streptomyces sp. NPDC049954 TaxID=3155779 RepID=UPI00343825F5